MCEALFVVGKHTCTAHSCRKFNYEKVSVCAIDLNFAAYRHILDLEVFLITGMISNSTICKYILISIGCINYNL